MASSSAAERSATTPELRHLRAQQVILVFSNQVRIAPTVFESSHRAPCQIATHFLTGLLLPLIPLLRAWAT